MPKESGVRRSPRIATSIPTPAGTVIATDTKTLERFFVYRPQTNLQLRCGHLDGQWYWQKLGEIGISPSSNPYRTRDEAIGSLIASQCFKECK
jgi:hypothetical protein